MISITLGSFNDPIDLDWRSSFAHQYERFEGASHFTKWREESVQHLDCLALSPIVVQTGRLGLRISTDSYLYTLSKHRSSCVLLYIQDESIEVLKTLRLQSAWAIYGKNGEDKDTVFQDKLEPSSFKYSDFYTRLYTFFTRPTIDIAIWRVTESLLRLSVTSNWGLHRILSKHTIWPATCREVIAVLENLALGIISNVARHLAHLLFTGLVLLYEY